MKSNKIILSLRRRMQRTSDGKLYSEICDGVEDDTMIKLQAIFPSLFEKITKDKGFYDIQVSIKRLA